MRTYRLFAIAAGLMVLPLTSDGATLAYKVDGNACHPINAGDAPTEYDRDHGYGLLLREVSATNGTRNAAVCPLRTGTNTVTTTSVDSVTARGRTALGADAISVTLVAHDIFSADYCECDTDPIVTVGFWSTTLSRGGAAGSCDDNPCPGGVYPGTKAWNYAVEFEIVQSNATDDNTLYVKGIALNGP